MFNSPFDFFSLVIAIVAFIFARKALNQTAALRTRLDPMETLASSAAATTPVPPPLPVQETAGRIARRKRQQNRNGGPGCAAASSAGDAARRYPTFRRLPPAQPGPGFEERIGTRWVVWVGGLTLALGGFFMVRYSIEAGLLGPGVRTLLGGAFALALLAAGEWTRRKESVSAIAALPIANIPAILTAAGTAVAFATVYAAYALYDFLAPATAFVLLGLVALGTLAAALLHGPALAGLGIAAAFVTPDPGFFRQARLLGAVYLSRRRHRRGLWAGADPAVALARGHHHRLRAALDLPLPAMRTVDGRPARIPRHGRVRPRSPAGGVRIHVRSAGGGRPDRADLVRIARGLSAGRDPDRAHKFPCRCRHHRVRACWSPAHCSWHGVRKPQPVQSPPRLRSSLSCLPNGRCAAIRTCWCCRADRCRASALPPPTVRSPCIWYQRRFSQSDSASPDSWRRAARSAPSSRWCGRRRRVHAAGALDRAVCPDRASRSLDPVCDPGGRARGGICRRHRNPQQDAKIGRVCRFRSRCSPPARSPRWRWR